VSKCQLEKNTPALMQLTEELTGISLLENGTVNPFFMLAVDNNAFQIPVIFSNKQQLEFTSVKIAAILQSKKCDHYCFATRIQFTATAGDLSLDHISSICCCIKFAPSKSLVKANQPSHNASQPTTPVLLLSCQRPSLASA